MDRLQMLLAGSEEDVAALDRLLDDEPHLLHNTSAAAPTTPLHIALLHGKVRFAAKILQKCPELADIRNEPGSFPIHRAAAGGHLEIVRQILEIKKGPSSLSLRDKDGRTPLMLAAANGQIDVLTYLLNLRVDRALSGQVSNRGETALHLCVKNNQVEAAEVLLNWNRDLVNVRDSQGNSVLHLATTKRQFHMLELFLTEPKIDVNAANALDFTARDVLLVGPSECVDMAIDELLKSYGCKRNLKPKRTILQNSGSSNVLWWTRRLKPSSWFQTEKKSEKWFKEKHNTLLIVATLIATVTFAAGLSPPGSVWQDSSPSPSASPHIPGTAIQNDNNNKNFKFFMYFDMCGLVSSLFIILFLVSRLPLKNHVTTWILVITMWVAVTSMTMAFVYGTRLVVVSDMIAQKLIWVLVSWSGLMVLLFFWHLVSAFIHLIHMFVKGIPIWSRVHLLRRERLSGETNSPDEPKARDIEMG